MRELEQLPEQRRNKRQLLDSESYAIIKLQDYSEVAQLIDISVSGISFLCINEGDWEQEPFFMDLSRSGIFYGSPPGDDTLENIPLHPLTYCEDNNATQASNNIMQKCGVRFAELTQEQKIRIDEFIAKNTLGSA